MADELRSVVPASEILEKIRKGEPIEYDNVIVEGDLDSTKLDLPTQQVERTKHETEVLKLSETAKIVASSILITNSEIKGRVDFSKCVLQKGVTFRGTQFAEDNAHFSYAKLRFADFSGAQFTGYAHFMRAQFTGYAHFMRAQFTGYANFNDAEFGDYANFSESQYTESDAYFLDARFEGHANFSNAKFGDGAFFDGAQFTGEILTFRNAIFADSRSQEDACRRAKNVLQKSGDREEEGYHFYREMEAKRKQKPWYYRYPEYVLIQLIFGYGVHPGWLWLWWIFFVGVFAFIYWLESGIEGAKDPIDYIWFSIATAATPGYALYRPEAGFKLVAGIEALMGTFMWAAFITTFARKYMR